MLGFRILSSTLGLAQGFAWVVVMLIVVAVVGCEVQVNRVQSVFPAVQVRNTGEGTVETSNGPGGEAAADDPGIATDFADTAEPGTSPRRDAEEPDEQETPPPSDDTDGEVEPLEPVPDAETVVTTAVPGFTRVTLVDDRPGAAWMTPADLNDDGLPEILLTCLSEGRGPGLRRIAPGGAYILEREEEPAGEGEWRTTQAFNRQAGIDFPNGSVLADVDNDGIDDWVIAAGSAPRPNGNIVWMRGSVEVGRLVFGEVESISLPNSRRWYREIVAADIDGDNDVDLLTTNHDSRGATRVEWFENMGIAGTAEFSHHHIAERGGAHLAVSDLDGDGDLDIILPQPFDERSLIWLEQTAGVDGEWAEHLIDDSSGRGFGAQVVDLDGDGQLEVLFGNHNHQRARAVEQQTMGVYWWDIPEPAVISQLEDWSAYKQVLYEGFNIAGNDPDANGAPGPVRAADIDGDGDLDVTVAGGGDDGLYIFFQHANNVFEKLVLDHGQVLPADHVVLDIDGDGDMDIVWAVHGEKRDGTAQSSIYGYLQQELQDPALPGSHGVLSAEVRVNRRDVKLYIPEGEGLFPVVVFHHGFMLGPDNYASYGRHLASWGYVVVMPQMQGGVVGPIGAPNNLELRAQLVGIIDWVEENALDANGPLAGKVDMRRLGLAGHSLGGKISLLTATEDDRPIAIFGIDPVDSAGGPGARPSERFPSVTPELMPLINVPLGLVGETTNATCRGPFCQACAPAEDNFQQYFAHAPSPVLEIEVLGANHMSFLDDTDCGLSCSVCGDGTDDPVETRRLTQRYLTAFFHVFLRGDDAYRTWLDGAAIEGDVASGLVTAQVNNGFEQAPSPAPMASAVND